MDTAQPAPAQCTVLVIDDEESSQVLARTALERIGVGTVVVAADGAAALRALERMPTEPDFVLCDIFMPESDGIEMINSLVQRRYAGGLVLVTGGDNQYLVIAKRIARFHGLRLLATLTKPMVQAELEQALFGPSGPSQG